MDVENVIREKVLEHYRALRNFDKAILEKTKDIVRNQEMVKVLKTKNKDLVPEDVADILSEIMISAYEQSLLNDQILKVHLPLFHEVRAIALACKIDIDFSEEDLKFISTLQNLSSYLLFVPTKDSVEPRNKEAYEVLLDKARKETLTEDNQKGCFEQIK